MTGVALSGLFLSSRPVVLPLVCEFVYGKSASERIHLTMEILLAAVQLACPLALSWISYRQMLVLGAGFAVVRLAALYRTNMGPHWPASVVGGGGGSNRGSRVKEAERVSRGMYI